MRAGFKRFHARFAHRGHYYSPDKIEREVAALPATARASANDKAKAQIRKKYQGSLKWLQIIRPEAFDALVRDLEKINSFSITMSTLSQEEPLFHPLAMQAKKVVHEFKFSDDGVLDIIKGGIRNTIARLAPAAAKVVGIDHHGMEQIIKLANNPDSFAEYEYDEVAGRMNFNPKEFAHSWFMNEIIKVVEAKPALFLAELAA